MAYFIIRKDNKKTYIIIDKASVAGLIGVHRHTITNWFKPDENGIAAKQKETDKYIVIKADEYTEPNKSRGNRDSNNDKKLKAMGEMPLKYPKKKKTW